MIEDYSLLDMEELPSTDNCDGWGKEYDYLISSFTQADRVKCVFEKCQAAQKHWLVLSEYGIHKDKHPTENEIVKTSILKTKEEKALTEINDWWNGLGINNAASLCIDATGFLRPTLLFLMKLLDLAGIKKYDVLYAEPTIYVAQEHTKFSDDFSEVKTIPFFGGIHEHKLQTRNLLIIAAGYEDKLIKEVAEKHNVSEKILIYGFPPLRADMFQESILRLYNAEQAIGDKYKYNASTAYFAPANDPFVTANMLRHIIKKETHNSQDYNIYLSPLSTKPQVLGFGLFYIAEKRDKTPCSIVFPFANEYTRESTKGIGRIWRYTIEIPK